MRHCDDETLAAIALGEPVDALEASHAAECETCAAQIAALRGTAARLTDASRIEMVAPPASVWAAIEAQLAAEGAVGRSVPTLVRDPVPSESAASAAASFPDEPFAGGGEPDELAVRRRRPSPWLVGIAAAAAGVVIGVAGVGLLTSGDDSAQTLVASAQLADLATEADAGVARVERRADGSEVLVVDTTFTDAGADNLEVWLIDTDVQGMVSLGYLTQGHEEFVIPAGYDVAAFPIVDISVEPADGVPTHSGDSITRGILS